jgi:NAD(P)-dependent dehydrogenase (short-subunit alcohol dehydrogenase family)
MGGVSNTRGILVTGAGSGIGRAIALHFGSRGDRVGCLDVVSSRASEVAKIITRSGGQACEIECDVSEEKDVERAVREFTSWSGSLDAVVSNAGIVLRKDLLATTVAEWDHTMAVNARGGFLMARASVPALTAAGGGVLIFITSVVAHIGFGLPAYTASKGALVALVRELAGELAHLGIRVNAVSPGTVEGTLVTKDSLADPKVRERTTSVTPLGRIATTTDIVNAVDFLVSDASAMITGHVLPVDGGISTSIYSLQRPLV